MWKTYGSGSEATTWAFAMAIRPLCQLCGQQRTPCIYATAAMFAHEVMPQNPASGCTLGHVMARSGERFERFLDTLAGQKKMHFIISTEKAGNAVLPRIDEAQPED